MKTWNHLYDQICSFGNLWSAALSAEREKRFEDAVGRFRTQREAEILRLRDELTAKTWQPGTYRTWMITCPKPRMISAAPFRDRVVHHAVCRVVMPLLERKMVFDLHSNRPGKGTHAAIRRAQEFSRRHAYVLKCDVRKFFPSMDHQVLKDILRGTIRCRDTLWLLDRIIDASNAQETVCTVFPGDDLAHAGSRRVGLPIGNLTSQWFGGVYLTPFDHWVKETLRCRGYVRYVDDFLLFGDDKMSLARWRAEIRQKLLEHRVFLHEAKSRVYPTRQGFSFLGQRIWPGRRRLLRANVSAARRRLRWQAREYCAGRLGRRDLEIRWQSWRGHAMQADGTALVKKVRAELRREVGAGGEWMEACCGAARGTIPQPTCVAPIATTTRRATTTPTTVSGVSGGFGA